MPGDKTSADAALQEILKDAVTPVLKSAGFKKAGTNYHRRLGEVVQVVNFQSSTGSTRDEKRVYINVGIAFDAICKLKRLPVSETPREYECDDRGTRDRLEELIQDVPSHWTIRATGTTRPTASALREAMERLLAELDHIQSPQTYRDHRWFNRSRPRPENAQVHYVLGDHDRAWAEVQALAAAFAGRQSADRPAWWVKELGLKELKARLG